MTCIAWDGHTLAADKRATSAGLIRHVTKISKMKDGSLFAYAGQMNIGLLMKEWLETGAKPTEFPVEQKDKDDWGSCLVIDKTGSRVYERTATPILFEDKQLAFGSGRDYALCAMHLGKPAPEAVEIACLFENGCGNGVDVLTL